MAQMDKDLGRNGDLTQNQQVAKDLGVDAATVTVDVTDDGRVAVSAVPIEGVRTTLDKRTLRMWLTSLPAVLSNSLYFSFSSSFYFKAPPQPPPAPKSPGLGSLGRLGKNRESENKVRFQR